MSSKAISDTVANELEQALRAHANPERAAQEQRYLKSDLQFIGLSVPAMRQVVRAFEREYAPFEHDGVVALVRALWARPVHELRSAATVLLDRQRRLLEPADLELIEALLRDSRTWALVDALATASAAYLVDRYPDETAA